MTLDKSEFRCGHGHSGYAHPKCYERYVKGVDAPKKVRTAKILLLDIETLPGEYYAFDPRVDYLAPAMQIKDWSISCWAAKWLFSEEIMGEVVTPEEAIARDDKSILGGIWDLMNEAQIVVTQNGINFDLKKLSSRFIEHDMFPPSHFLNVDTLKTARETFGWSYNRLDEVGQKLGIGKKIPMNIDDWKKCLTGDSDAKQALNDMLFYCKNDVAPLLEDVYLKELPYMKSHPNLGIYADHDTDVCPRCESSNLKWGLEYPTPSGLWKGWRCRDCGSVGRGLGKKNKIRGTNIG